MARGDDRAVSAVRLRRGSLSAPPICAKASTWRWRRGICHSLFCSKSPAPLGPVIEVSFGSKGMTAIRPRECPNSDDLGAAPDLLVQALDGLVPCSVGRCRAGKAIKANTLCPVSSMAAGGASASGAALIGSVAPGLAGAVAVRLVEGLADRRGDTDDPASLVHFGQCLPREGGGARHRCVQSLVSGRLRNSPTWSSFGGKRSLDRFLARQVPCGVSIPCFWKCR